MSKGNMLLGHARGKVGSLVFSRANGKQIVRARAEVVKNPRTRAQLIQRIIINTVAQAYSLMRPILDHSFEGIAKGQASMSYFNSHNAKQLREQVAAAASLYNVEAFSPLGTNTFALNAYRIAKGSLPQIVPTFVFDEQTSEGTGKFAAAANTYEGIISQYGLQRGDQLTFVVVHEVSGGSHIFDYVRVILDPRNEDGTEAPLTTAFAADNAVVLPSAKNEGVFSTLSFAGGQFSFVIGSKENLVAVGVIVSRKGSDGNWMRSNADLVVPAIDVLEIGTSMGEALDMAIQGSVDVESPYYLNNAGVTTKKTAAGNDAGGGNDGGDDLPGGGAGGEG